MNNAPWSLWALSLVVATFGCGAPLAPGSETPPSSNGTVRDAAPAPACATDRECTSEEPACCDGSCLSLAYDPNHCGACHHRCPSGEHCANQGSCELTSLQRLCTNGFLTGLLDGDPTDEDAVRRILSHFREHCGGQTNAQSASDSALLNPAGQPLSHVGTTLLAAGGGYRQPMVRYLDQRALSPVFTDTQDGGATARLIRRDSGEVLAEVSTTAPPSDQDVFVSYLVEDPDGGSLLWVAYGLFAQGTRAAAIWLTEIAPNLSLNMDTRWAAVRWSDSDDVSGPTYDDQFDIMVTSP